MSARLTSSLVTILVGLFLLLPQIIHGLSARQQGSVACAADDAGRRQTAPRIISPRDGDRIGASEPVTFRVAPADETHTYRWEIMEDGIVLADAERPIHPSSPGDVIGDFFQTWALSNEIRNGTDEDQPINLMDEMTGAEFHFVPDELPDWPGPGELTALVSERACGEWQEVASATVQVEE